jgi:hypothetical protein
VGIDDCLRFAVGNAMPKGLGCVTLCHASMGHLSVCVCVCVRACVCVCMSLVRGSFGEGVRVVKSPDPTRAPDGNR